MNFSKHFLLIEFKRKMSYKLQNVMSFEFNIIQNIYEIARLAQLKKDHYKRIDDVKSRKRSSAVAIVEIETKATISKIISITTISTSINEKTEQTFFETTIWNSNQFCSSNSREFDASTSIRTFNFDSTREQFMKKSKCFNYDESDHLSRDCTKFRKFRVVEMNVKKKTKNSRKK